MKTTFKKALSLAMVLMMVISTMVILPLTASAETGAIEPIMPTGYGDGVTGQTAENPYLLSEPGHLVYLGQQTMRGGYYTLANDIDMAGVTNFYSLKTDANSSVIFNGNNFAIKNLTVTDGMGGAWVSGLLGMSRGNDVIKNLKMVNLCVDNTWSDGTAVGAQAATNNNIYIGGLVGQANEGSSLTIENVTIDNQSVIKTGNIYNSSSTKQDTLVGGFIGCVTGAKKITITNCENNASINGNIGSTTSSFTGGFIGQHKQAANLTFENCTFGGAEIRGVYAGGFVGNFGGSATVTFKNCTTDTAMVGNQAGAVGGYVAYVNNTSTHLVAENCVAKSTGTTYYCGNTSCKMGGFYGWLNGCGSATFTDCVNKAEMDNKGQSGGFIGRTNKPALTFTRCINEGFIATYGSWEAGGFCGYLDNTDTSNAKTIKFEYCLNKGGVYAQSTAGGFIATVNGNLSLDFDYCANMARVRAASTTNSNAYGANAVGGFVGAVLNGTGNDTIAMDNCFNNGTMTMAAPAGSYSGFGGLIGTLHQHTATGNKVAFTNCYVNATVDSANTMGDYYGKRSNGDSYTLITTVDCATGDAAAAGITNLYNAITDIVTPGMVPNTSKLAGKLSLRMKLTDDFGFMAIVNAGDVVERVNPTEYGFLYATVKFETADEATKAAAEAYNGDESMWMFTYTELTAATLDQKVYIAAYTVVEGETYISEVREINVLSIVTDLGDDGKLGNAVVTENGKEIALYAQMVAYHNAYKGYLDSVTPEEN